MDDGDEAHEAPGRLPQQITQMVLELDIRFAIDGAGHFLQRTLIAKERFEANLVVIDSGPAASLRSPRTAGRRRRWSELGSPSDGSARAGR